MFIHAETKLDVAQQAKRDKMLSLQKAQSMKFRNDFGNQVLKYSKPRAAVYDMVDGQAYGAVMLGVILLYSVMMAFYNPLEGDSEGANWLLKQSEKPFTLVFLFDVLCQLTHSGLRRFFGGKDKLWNLLDVVVVAAGLAAFLPGTDNQLGMLRMLRVLRPLRTLNKVESVKHVAVALGSSIPGLANVFALVMFVIFIYALFGVKLWVGTLEGRCALPMGVEGESSLRFCNIMLVTDGTNAQHTCGTGADRYVPNKFTNPESGYCCAPESCFVVDSPDGGFTGFNSIQQAILTVFNTMTLEGWSGTVFALSQAEGGWVLLFYFCTLLVLGGLLVTNYLLAECCVVFGMHMENIKLAQEYASDKVRMDEIRDHLTLDGQMPKVPLKDTIITGTEVDGLADDEMAELERPVKKSCWIKLGKCRRRWGERRSVRAVGACVSSRNVETLLTVAIFANFILLGLEHHEMDPTLGMILNTGNLVLTFVFALEMCLKLFALGLMGYFKDMFNAYDAVIVVTSLAEIAMSGEGSTSILRTLRVFRIARSFKLIKSGSSLCFVLETALMSLAAVASFGGLLMLMMYIYTLIGMNVFGGKLVTVDGDDVIMETPLGNYDTFVTGFVTVFQVATRENWTSLLFNAMAIPDQEPVVAVVFYVSLVLLTNYILLALFMGTLLENFQKEFVAERDRTKPKLNIGSIMLVVRARHRFMAIAKRVRENPGQILETRSFMIFSSKGCLRKQCVRITKADWFDSMVMAAIFVSSFLLAIEHPNDMSGTTSYRVLKWFDIILTAFFTAEMLVKMIAVGLFGHHRSYFREGWHVLDFFVVATSIINLTVTTESVKYLRVLRAVRVLKSIQHMKIWPNLQVVVSSLIFSIPSIITICGLGLFFTLIMAILFQQLFGGALYVCTDPGQHEKLMCVGTWSADGTLADRMWQNNERNYDNVVSSLLVMLELLTIEDWNSIMASAIESTDPDHGPVPANNPGWGFLFMMYIVLGSFFVMNLFVGVIVTAYNDAKIEADLGLGSQGTADVRRIKRIKDTHDTALYAYHQTRNQTSKGWRGPFIKLMYQPSFDTFVMLAIVSNVGVMCVEYGSWVGADLDLGCKLALDDANCSAQADGNCMFNPITELCEPFWGKQDLNRVPGMSPALEDFATIASEVFAYIFTLEMTIKILALGVSKWWDSLWNRFDFLIVVTSLIEVIMLKLSDDSQTFASMFRIFRICRVFRFVRVSEKAKGIKNLVETFVETLPYLANVAVVLLIFVFIYAVVGVSLFTNVKQNSVLGEDLNFSTFGRAVETLLLVATGENWTDLMRSCMITAPTDRRPGPDDCGGIPDLSRSWDGMDSWGRDLSGVYIKPPDDCGHTFLAPIFFMSFMILTTYVSLNIMVAVILFTFFDIEGNPAAALGDQHVEKFMEATQSSDIDYDQNGMIEISQLQTFLTKLKAPLGIEGTLAMTLEEDWLTFMKGEVVYVNGEKQRLPGTGLHHHMTEAAKTRRLLVVHGATGIADADGLGASDPYAKVWWNGRELGQTDTVFETLDPTWDAEYLVDLAESKATNYIRVELYDQDNADHDDFLGQVEIALPGGRSHDAFVNKSYELGRTFEETLPVSDDTAAGQTKAFFNRCRKTKVSDSVDIGQEGVTGTVTISLKKTLWVDTDGEAEVEREELLRFCIKRKYDVDVRPPKKTEQKTLSAGRLANMALSLGTTRNMVEPDAVTKLSPRSEYSDDGNSHKANERRVPKLSRPLSTLGSKNIAQHGQKSAAGHVTAIGQLDKLTPRDEDGISTTAASGSKTSPRSPRVQFDASAPPPPLDELGAGPGPRKPRAEFDASSDDLISPTRSKTQEYLSGLDSTDQDPDHIPEAGTSPEKEARSLTLPGAMP